MKKSYILLIVAFFLIVCNGEDSILERHDLDLRVHFIDVGHGDCIFILTPNDTIEGNGECEGYRILIDAGKKGRGSEYVIPYLRNQGMEDGYTIDYVIATHSHEDHVGGMPEIYDTYQVNNTLDPGYHYTTNAYNDFYNKALNEPNSNFYFNLVESGLITGNGGELDLGSELQARILYTNPDDSSGINNTSIVLWIKYCDVSFLFMALSGSIKRIMTPVPLLYYRRKKSVYQEGVDLERTRRNAARFSKSFSDKRIMLRLVSLFNLCT